MKSIFSRYWLKISWKLLNIFVHPKAIETYIVTRKHPNQYVLKAFYDAKINNLKWYKESFIDGVPEGHELDEVHFFVKVWPIIYDRLHKLSDLSEYKYLFRWQK